MKTSELIALLSKIDKTVPFDAEVRVGSESYESKGIARVQHDPPDTLLELDEREPNLHASTRVPVDDRYAALVGKATYVFAFYEWTIIYLIDRLEPGFVSEYSRGNRPFTSGAVAVRFMKAIERHRSECNGPYSKELLSDMAAIHDEFSNLKDARNQLLHAHPYTAVGGAQQLAYQGKHPGVKWDYESTAELIQTFDAAAVRAAMLFDRVRQLGN